MEVQVLPRTVLEHAGVPAADRAGRILESNANPALRGQGNQRGLASDPALGSHS